MAEKRRESGGGGGSSPSKGSSEPDWKQGQCAHKPPGDPVKHTPADGGSPVRRFTLEEHAVACADRNAGREMHHQAECWRGAASQARDPGQPIDRNNLGPEDVSAEEARHHTAA